MQEGETGKGKRFWENLFRGATKDKFIIFILAGILLFIIALPTERAGKNKAEAEGAAGSAEQARQGDAVCEASEEADALYVSRLEERLTSALRLIDGVGSVKVMVTLKTSAEKIVEKDTPSSRSGTTETDSGGGRRSIQELQIQESTVYETEGNGVQTPYVVKSVEPKVEGIVVIAKGGGNAEVKKNITEALQALFGIEAHKIKVLKMKTE